MEPQEAKRIVRSIDGQKSSLSIKDVDTDADTVILQIQDTDRGPRNFHPETLANLLQHSAVFDLWVESDKLYVQLS